MAAVSCFLLDLGYVVVNIDFRGFADRMRALTGLEEEPLRAAIMGDDLANRYEKGLLDDGDFRREVCRRVHRQIQPDEFDEAWNSIFIPTPLLPEELVSRLAQKRPLWVVSNTNSIHFEFVRRHYPLLRHFTGFVLSYEIGMAKPDPAVFRYALDRAGVEAGEALFVDDQSANVEAARSLGIDAFQFVNPDQFVREVRLRQLL